MTARLRARTTLSMLLTLLLAVGLAMPASAHQRPPTVQVVADGFVGPLGLAVDHRDTAYVAEAFAGLLTTVDRKGNRDVLVDGAGREIAGVDANWLHVSYVTTTYGAQGPAIASSLERVRRTGSTEEVASLYDHEFDTNPDGDVAYGFGEDVAQACRDSLPPPPDGPPPNPYAGILDTHPYAVRNVLGGYVVADAAANAILTISHGGRVRTLAVLPPVPQVIDQATADAFGLDASCLGETYLGEPVPTDVEVGWDGHYYVTTLPGAPELPGAGAVWRVNRFTGATTMIASGLSGAVDLAIGHDRTIYVAELFANRISKVSRSGNVSTYVEVPSPGAVETGRGRTLWATTDVFGNGTLVKITR